MTLQFSSEQERQFDKNHNLEVDQPTNDIKVDVEQILADSFRIMDSRLQLQKKQKNERLTSHIHPMLKKAECAHQKIAAAAEDALIMRDKYKNFNEFIVSERETLFSEKEKHPRQIKEKVAKEKQQVRQIKRNNAHFNQPNQQEQNVNSLKIDQSNTFVKSSQNLVRVSKRGTGGPYLPTVVDPFSTASLKRDRNSSYDEDQSQMQRRKPRKIKKISQNLQARKVLAKIKKQSNPKSIKIQKSGEHSKPMNHEKAEITHKESLSKYLVEPVSQQQVPKDQKLRQLLSFINDEEPTTPVAESDKEATYQVERRQSQTRRSKNSSKESAFVSEIKQQKAKFFKQLEQKQRRQEKIAQPLKASLKQFRLKQQRSKNTKKKHQKQLQNTSKASSQKQEKVKVQTQSKTVQNVASKKAEQIQIKQPTHNKNQQIINKEDKQMRRKRKGRQKHRRNSNQKLRNKKTQQEEQQHELKTQLQYKRQLEKLKEELRRQKMKKKSHKNRRKSKSLSPQYQSSVASSSSFIDSSKSSSSESSTSSWQRQLRKVTHYNPRDRHYRQRDKCAIIESGFSQMNREQAYSRKMGYRDEQIMQQHEKKRNKRRRDY